MRDAGKSAKTLERPGLSRILEAVEAGTIGAVVVLKLDRLTRSVKDLADLLAYIDASVTPARSFAGNRPAVVKPDAHGAIRLRASNAEIYGQGIEFESQYKNLGMWNGQNDRAV